MLLRQLSTRMWLALNLSSKHHRIVELRSSHLAWQTELLGLSWNLLKHLLVESSSLLLGLNLIHHVLLLLRNLMRNHVMHRGRELCLSLLRNC